MMLGKISTCSSPKVNVVNIPRWISHFEYLLPKMYSAKKTNTGI